MDFAEAYTILRNGDGNLMKEFIARSAGNDSALAVSVVASLRKELGKARFHGIVMLILGIPLLALFGIGILPIGIAVWRFMQYRRGTKVLNEGYGLYAASA